MFKLAQVGKISEISWAPSVFNIFSCVILFYYAYLLNELDDYNYCAGNLISSTLTLVKYVFMYGGVHTLLFIKCICLGRMGNIFYTKWWMLISSAVH